MYNLKVGAREIKLVKEVALQLLTLVPITGTTYGSLSIELVIALSTTNATPVLPHPT